MRARPENPVHIANIRAVLDQALKIAEVTRLEVHGISEELAKLSKLSLQKIPIHL